MHALCVCLFVCFHACPFICNVFACFFLSVCLFFCLSVRFSVCLSVRLFFCLSVCPSVFLSIGLCVSFYHAPYPALYITVSGVEWLQVSDWLSGSCDLSNSLFDWTGVLGGCDWSARVTWSFTGSRSSLSTTMDGFSSTGASLVSLPSLSGTVYKQFFK